MFLECVLIFRKLENSVKYPEFVKHFIVIITDQLSRKFNQPSQMIVFPTFGKSCTYSIDFV